jgi:hypothetical protein
MRYVYDWCTDFSEDDPKITGSTSQRKVLEKTKKRVTYVQIYQGSGRWTEGCCQHRHPEPAEFVAS